ncbi:MAG: aminotransferase class V-fold PLP-dependent enzyme [Allomuricauda sp.]
MGILKTQRDLFDIPEHIAYFNCAYYSPLLKESASRLHTGVSSKSRPWERTPADFFNDAESVRQLSSDIFGGDPNGFAVVPSASYGISSASRILESTLTKNDGVLVVAEEFPSIVLSMKRLANETGAKLITVETPEDKNWTEAILNRMDGTIRVVAISSCHWTNGAFIDLKRIREKCDECDTILLIDATQTLGAMPLSIEEIRPDFLVASGYKWLLSPYGFSLFYVDGRWRNERPLEETWVARENAQDFANLVDYSDAYMKGSRRFEVGEKCTPTILPGAIAALEQIKEWGVDNIAETLLNINQQIEKNLLQLGFTLPPNSQRCPHMLGAVTPPNSSQNLVAELKSRNIYISQRGRSLRFAPHLYINDNDIDRLNSTISELIGG